MPSRGTRWFFFFQFRTFQKETTNSPNGNSVNLELEMFKAADAQSQHEMALSVYTKSLDLLRTAIGNRR